MGIRRGFKGCRRASVCRTGWGRGGGAGCGQRSLRPRKSALNKIQGDPTRAIGSALESISQAQTRVRLNLKAVSRSPSDTKLSDASPPHPTHPQRIFASASFISYSKKEKWHAESYRHTNQYTRPHYLDFILKCGLCWIICAIVNPARQYFSRISEISISRDFFYPGVEGQRTRLPIHVRVTIYNPKYLTPDSNIFHILLSVKYSWQFLASALGMGHLPRILPSGLVIALDGHIRAIGIPVLVHGASALVVHILGCHLSIGKEPVKP